MHSDHLSAAAPLTDSRDAAPLEGVVSRPPRADAGWAPPHGAGGGAGGLHAEAPIDAPLEQSAGRLRSLFELHVDGVFTVAPDGTLGRVNAAGAALAGVAGEELRGRALLDLVVPDDHERSRERLGAALAGTAQSWEADLVTADGGQCATQLTAMPIIEAGEVVGAFVVAHDVSSHRAIEAQLAHRAFHDPLTGLANRALFRDRTEKALARDPSGAHVAVIFVDLDDFKKVNDTMGHAAGDELLMKVSALLLESTRGCDLVARFGGDEFAVLLGRIAQPDHVAAVAARVAAALRRKIALRGRDVVVGASLGIAHGRAGMGADELLRDADLAMYRAKAAGKGNLATYGAGGHADAADRLALHEDLRLALAGDPAAGRLSLAYQPVVELATGRVSAYEAFARWWHPTRGDVPPQLFVALAEETGLIIDLGRWVLRGACEQLRRWEHAAPESRPCVRVNLSRVELEQPTLLRDVADALEGAGVAAGRLTLELSEASVMRRPDEALVTLHGLHELGVRLAIDDFGSAASSIGHLQRFPVDELKIDRGIVDGVPHDANCSAVARSIVALGRALDLRTVAEGVERPAQRAVLADMGCEMAQGFLFAAPGAADAVHPSALPTILPADVGMPRAPVDGGRIEAGGPSA